MGSSSALHSHYQSSWAESRKTYHSYYLAAGGSTTESVPRVTGSPPVFVDYEKTMAQLTSTTQTQFTEPNHMGRGKANSDEDDSTTILSTDSIAGAGLLNMTDDDEPHDDVRTIMDGVSARLPPQQTAGTTEATSSVCSSSTAMSTEVSSLGGMGDWAPQFSNETASRMMQPQQHFQNQQHRRVPSWEVSPHNQFAAQSGDRGSPAGINLPASFSPSGWSNLVRQQQHVASFRSEQQYQQGYPPIGRLSVNTNHLIHQHDLSPRYGVTDSSLPFLPQSVGRGGQGSPRGMYHRQINNGNYFYPVQQQRKSYIQPPLPPSATNTPPRVGSEQGGGGGQGHQRVLSSSGQSPHRSQQSLQGSIGGGGNSRSSSEILKTLLRKKACLYEPDTSRAVALVTWLVGRELALQYGFFSRQQLQAGVHACVSSKIESGVITRTKVNRCMQIILNSCFHYIIPRPDGTEESGDSFRGIFAAEMNDDSFLLSVLPPLWNDIVIDRNTILAACEEESDCKSPKKWTFETPVSSPRLGSVADKGSPSKESLDGDSDAKRAVLLCFNENVRRAEDVFRCHNEFIRDTAHACNLQLSSNEWQVFFGREAASAPYLWGNVGIPVPHLEGQSALKTDALGVLTSEEVGVLRSTWCSKRYDHDHELCGFAHAEINGGWLRRDPSRHSYKAEMCQFVSSLVNARSGSKNTIFINECPLGVNCDYAHSLEEIIYHPRCYKQRTCSSMGRTGGCPLGDVCPSFHPTDSYRFPKKSDSRSPRHSRQNQQSSIVGKATPTPASTLSSGSPILYVSPAPMSSFERHLLLPGLQNLFRRNCAVKLANLRTGSIGTFSYSCFGDDDGIINAQKETSQSNVIVPPPCCRS